MLYVIYAPIPLIAKVHVNYATNSQCELPGNQRLQLRDTHKDKNIRHLIINMFAFDHQK